jgi:glyoxylase-like metal-dependent hydrolase (beta-lactamase superfamily II)/rhodanese-related sulfurtransferase
MMTTSDLSIDMETVRQWLEQGRPLTLLDVRPAEERAEWAIPGSIHVDAYHALKAGDRQALAGVALPGDAPVITICGAGKVSLIAAQQLQARGVPARSLRGGMQAWSLAWNTAEVSVPGSAAQVIQVRRTGKGCLSYLIGADDAATVIDPALPPDVYCDLAQRQGWRITQVLETHLHADHLSRARALAGQTGATLLLPAGHRVAAPFTALADGATIAIGAARLTVLYTPGHTPESACYLLDGAALFTGDTLFLAAVGRPDLHTSTAGARAQAQALYRSLQRLLRLDPGILVLPGHISDPVAFNGQPVGAALGEIRARLALLREGEATFVDAILARIPPTPPNHEQIIALNEAGVLPMGDPTALEAGANRCAVA